MKNHDLKSEYTRFQPEITKFNDIALLGAKEFGIGADAIIEEQLDQLIRLRVALKKNCLLHWNTF